MSLPEKCPVCGSHGLCCKTEKEVPYTYRGQKTILHLWGDWCPQCGEIIMDDAGGERMEQQVEEFKRKVHAASSSFIRSTREKLGISLKEAGVLFGGGTSAFSKYEEDQVTPPVALVTLFQVLDKHPELLAEIREGHQII